MNNLLYHIPILQVTIPLTIASMCTVLNSPIFSWVLATFTTLVSLIISITLFCQVDANENISYVLGNWKSIIGMQYKIDIFNSLFLVLISFSGFISVIYSLKITETELSTTKRSLFYSFFLFCFTGFLGTVVTYDFFNIYVFLELAYLSSYAFIAMGSDKKSTIAGFQYLIIGSIAAISILFGLCFLYIMTGTLNVTDMSMRLTPIYHLKIVKTGISFILVGLLLKLAIFPKHKYLLNIYGHVPVMIASFLSAASGAPTIVGSGSVRFYLLIRLIYTVITMKPFIIGGLYSLREKNLKESLAYSTTSQIGYVILALTASINSQSPALLAAGILFIIYHAVTKPVPPQLTLVGYRSYC